MTVKVTFKGPMFDGTADKVLDEIVDDAALDVAQEAYNRVRKRLRQVLKHPTGYYESKVSTDRTSSGAVITDGGVIYGAWLEGVSSRNNASRFKGYNTFRTVAQQLGSEVEVILDRSVQKNIGRLQ